MMALAPQLRKVAIREPDIDFKKLVDKVEQA